MLNVSGSVPKLAQSQPMKGSVSVDFVPNRPMARHARNPLWILAFLDFGADFALCQTTHPPHSSTHSISTCSRYRAVIFGSVWPPSFWGSLP